jgi:hypothetical protein
MVHHHLLRFEGVRLSAAPKQSKKTAAASAVELRGRGPAPSLIASAILRG